MRTTKLGLSGLLALAVAAAIGAVAVSCGSVNRAAPAPPPVIEGATFVGNKACLDCHTNITRQFPSSPHARLHFEGSGLAGSSGCESCHGPGSKHIAAGGGRGRFIVNPGRDPAACYVCHLEVHAQFNLPQHHPVPEGKLNCVQCHDPHGPDIMRPAKLVSFARQNETCAQCHRDQTRPFIYEHEALREGCTACHVPHGSINAKMLTERDPNLCLRCHAQVPGPAAGTRRIFIGNVDHTTRLSQGTCWSAGCHTAVHGSSVNPRLLY
jgi:predicted CXXCH cytochrome family protein